MSKQLPFYYSKAIKYSEADEERGFHQAIHENPQETTPVYAYADWLEEHNRPGEAAMFKYAADNFPGMREHFNKRGDESFPVVRIFGLPSNKKSAVRYAHSHLKHTSVLMNSSIPSLFDPTKEFYLQGWIPNQEEAKTILLNLKNEGHQLLGVDYNTTYPSDETDEETTARVSGLPRKPR